MASVIPSLIDERVRGWLDAHEIAYQSTSRSHRAAVRLERRAWEDAAGITYGDVARRS